MQTARDLSTSDTFLQEYRNTYVTPGSNQPLYNMYNVITSNFLHDPASGKSKQSARFLD